MASLLVVSVYCKGRFTTVQLRSEVGISIKTRGGMSWSLSVGFYGMDDKDNGLDHLVVQHHEVGCCVCFACKDKGGWGCTNKVPPLLQCMLILLVNANSSMSGRRTHTDKSITHKCNTTGAYTSHAAARNKGFRLVVDMLCRITTKSHMVHKHTHTHTHTCRFQTS